MKLVEVEITGYRSIRDAVTLHLDDRVTVLLGANDHGKTNVLSALRHLNPDHGFAEEDDLNLDCDDASAYPALIFTLKLESEEQYELANFISKARWLASLDEFEQTWTTLARDYRSSADEAGKALAEAEKLLAELHQSEEVPEEQDVALIREAEEGLAAANAKASAEATNSELASLMVPLATALRSLGWNEDEAAFQQLVEEANQTVDAAAAGVESAARQRSQMENARQEAVAQHGEGTEQVAEADKNLAAAQQLATTAESSRVRATTVRDRLSAAVAAWERFRTGEFQDDANLGPIVPVKPPPVDISERIVLSRIGLGGDLRYEGEVEDEGDLVMQRLPSMLPRVELVLTQESISDVVTADTVEADENDFMRGIFRYAGLDPTEWTSLFAQNDRTTRRIDDANAVLNARLRAAWSQGSELEFQLDHRGDQIELKIKDPAVSIQYVRPSKRSSGFTHFFSMKTALYARECASRASSFIWLFDEPGIYLHPEGQHDLIAVLETLGRANQVAYTTHSIFLINKNYPARHRLLKKTDEGTIIDGKPYTARWGAAIEALGLGLPGTILFASKVLLVEGDSDPILLGADLQKLIEFEDIRFDVNDLSIMATTESKHADALLRVLSESSTSPRIALLFDGDEGGRNRHSKLKATIDLFGAEAMDLGADTTVEDHVLSPATFREATTAYVQAVANDPARQDEIETELRRSFDERFPDAEVVGLAKWSREEGAVFLGGEPSSVGIAREYVRRIADLAIEEVSVESRQRAKELAERMNEMLAFEAQTLEQAEIVSEA